MLEELFYSKNMAKTIEFFIIHEKWEQIQKDLCEYLNIYPEAMREILKKLSLFKLIIITRTIAKSKFYKLNPESDLVNSLRILIQKLSLQLTIEESEREGGSGVDDQLDLKVRKLNE